MSSERMAVLFLLFLLTATANALDTPVPSDPHEGESAVPIAKLKLAWLQVPEAVSYTVEMATDRDFANALPLEKATVTPPANRADAEYTVALAKPAKLANGTKYFWRVTANCDPADATCRPATSPALHFTTASAFLAPFRLTQAVDGDGAKKPAQFKYAHSVDKGTVASADFALQYRGEEHRNILFLGYVEGVLKSSGKTSDTAIRPAFGIVHDYARSDWSFVSKATIVHESDQRFDTRKLFVSASTTPILSPWIGTGIQLPHRVRLVWEPTFGVNLGRTLEAGDSTEVSKHLERYFLTLDGAFVFDWLAEKLNVRQVRLVISDKGWLLPREDADRHNLFSATLVFPVADKVSVGLAFKHGKDAPELKKTHDYGLTVGVQLGK